MKLIIKKCFFEKKILVNSPYYQKKKEKKGRKREYPPFFRPTPAPHPTQEIARKKKSSKKITLHKITQ
jgi:hypothetical protein